MTNYAMTNYNERLDKMLSEHGAEPGEMTHSLKQALASLIKELATEAKPERKSTEDYGSWEEGHRNVGWNNCLEHYEQNLLKELEER